MPSLDDVYRKFGEAAEAAQLIETGLGNMLLLARATNEGLFTKQYPEKASDIVDSIDRHTLGQLIKSVHSHVPLDSLDNALAKAREQRNRLFHSFYREHNFRRNSEEGRLIMIQDLESIHSVLLDAFKALLALEGVDVDTFPEKLPTQHLPL